MKINSKEIQSTKKNKRIIDLNLVFIKQIESSVRKKNDITIVNGSSEFLRRVIKIL